MNYEKIFFQCAIDETSASWSRGTGFEVRDFALNRLSGAVGTNLLSNTKAAFVSAVEAYFLVLEDCIEAETEQIKAEANYELEEGRTEFLLEAADYLAGLLPHVKTLDLNLVVKLAEADWDETHGDGN